MASYDFDQSLLIERFAVTPSKKKGGVEDGVDTEVLSRLAASADATEDLAGLFRDNQQLYWSVMSSLQRVLSNSDMNVLHAEVSKMASAGREMAEGGFNAVSQATEGLTGALMSTGPSTGATTPSAGGLSGMDSGGGSVEVIIVTPAGEFSLYVDANEAVPDYKPPASDLSVFQIPGIEIIEAVLDFEETASSGTAVPSAEGGEASTEQLPKLLGGALKGRFKDNSFVSGEFGLELTVKGDEGEQQRVDVQASFDGEVTLPGLSNPVQTSFEIGESGVHAVLSLSTELGGPLEGLTLSGEIDCVAADTISANGTLTIGDTAGEAFNGELRFQFEGTWDSKSATGTITIMGMDYLLDQETLELTVAYQAEEFTASLAAPISHTSQKDGLTTTVEVREFSYKTGAGIDGEGGVSVDFGGYARAAVQSCRWVKNELESTVLTFETSEFRLPTEQPLVTGAVNGSVSFDGTAFSGATLGGNFNFAVGEQQVPINFEGTVDAEGKLAGTVSLTGSVDVMGVMQVDSLVLNFDSAAGITSAEGAAVFQAGDFLSGSLQASYAQGSGFAFNGAGSLSDSQGAVGNGTFALNLTDAVSGTASFTMGTDYGLPDRSAGPLYILPGTTVTLGLEQNALQPASLQNGSYRFVNPVEGAGTIEGSFGGTLDFDSGMLTADGDARFTQDWEIGSGNTRLTILAASGSQLRASVVDSQLQNVAGTIGFSSNLPIGEQNIALQGEVQADYDAVGNSLTGNATASLQESIALQAGSNSLTILPESSVRMAITANELSSIGFDLHGEAVLTASAIEGEARIGLEVGDATYVPGTGLSGTGQANLAADVNIVEPRSGIRVTLKQGGEINGTLLNNELTTVTGQLGFATQMPIRESRLELDGELTGMTLTNSGGQVTVGGTVSAQVSSPFVFTEGSSELTIRPETTISATMTDNALSNASFGLKAQYSYSGAPCTTPLVAEIDGQVDYADEKFNGSASATLSSDSQLGFGESTVTLKAPGAVRATLVDNQVQTLSGELPFAATVPIVQGQSLQVEGQLSGSYENGGESATVQGSMSAATTADMQFVAGSHKLSVLTGTGVSGEMLNGTVSSARFNLQAAYEYAAAPFTSPLRAAITGEVQYEEGTGIGGSANATLSENAVLQVGANQTSVTLKQGSAATAVFEANEFKSLTGNLGFAADIPIIQEQVVKVDGTLNGSYTQEGGAASVQGDMTASLSQDIELTSGEHKFSILTGTTVSGAMVDAVVTSASFGLNAKYEYGGRPFTSALKADLTGDVQYVDGVGISGSAGATLSQDAVMTVGTNNTTVTLKQGSTATAAVESNELRSVTGQLGFAADLPVIQEQVIKVDGQLNGSYSNANGQSTVQGTLEAALREDVRFTSGEHQFSVLSGTSVNGAMTDGEVDSARFGLNAKYQYGGAPFTSPLMADITGEVNYAKDTGLGGSATATLSQDAVLTVASSNTITLKSGSTATALVEANELKSVSGELGFKADVPIIQEQVIKIDGSLNGSYRNEGGTAHVEGAVTAGLQEDIELTNGEHTFAILTGTTVGGQMADGRMTSAHFGLNARYEYGGAPFTSPLVAGITGEANYEEATGIGGSVTATLSSDAVLAVGSSSITLKAATTATALVESSQLKSVSGELGFKADIPIIQDQVIKLDGTLSGSYTDEGGTAQVVGDVTASLTEAVELNAGEHKFSILDGTTVSGHMENAAMTSARFGLNARYEYGGAPFSSPLVAGITGEANYAQETGLGGSVTATLEANASLEVGSSTLTLKSGSTGTAAVEANELKSIAGSLLFDAEIPIIQEQRLAVTGAINGSYENNAGTASVSGDISASTTADIELVSGSHKLGVLTGTGVTGAYADGALTAASLQLNASYEYSGSPFSSPLQASITGRVDYAESTGIAGTARAALTADAPMQLGESTVTLMSGSSVDANFTNTELRSLNGTLQITGAIPIIQGQVAQITGTIEGSYTNAEGAAQVQGRLEAQLTNEISLTRGSHQFTLLPDTGVHGQFAEGAVTEAGFDLKSRYQYNGTPFTTPLVASVEGNVTYREGEGISGGATINLTSDAVMAIGQNTVTLKESSGLQATVENTELKSIEGQINLEASIPFDGRALEITGHIEGRYANEGGAAQLNGSITAGLKNPFEMQVAGGTLTLQNDTQVTAELAEGQFSRLGFDLHATYARSENPQLQLDLTMMGAEYTPDGGFTGTGSATVSSDRCELLSVGAYKLFLLGGSGAEVVMEQSQLKSIGGNVNVMLTDETGADFIRAGVEANYRVQENLFSGSGSAEVLVEKELANVAGLTLFLCPGSGATINVADNQLQNIGGTINLRLDDEQGAFMTINLEGSFDAAGGGTFSGTGGATITRDKELGRAGQYTFWLAEGAGASVTITNNQIERVGGNIPFKLTDGQPEPLIVGSAEGTYVAASQTFSGTGAAYLGRDIEYEVTSDTRIVFKEGSGGNTTVTDNVLQSLGGTMNVDVYKDGENLVSISGSGTYDAVQNKLVEATGTATLNRDITLFDGKAVISNVSGTATIRDNRLVQAGGSARAVITIENNVEISGTVNRFNWSCETGTDQYEIDGSLNVRMLKPELADKISGSVTVQYNSASGLWNVRGELDYRMNEMIAGKINAEINQNWELTLGGTLEVNDVVLIPGRDLIKFGKGIAFDIPLGVPGINATAGVDFGIGLSMQPLTFSASIEVSNFKPAEMNVPNFEAQLSLSTGLNLRAELAPYLGISIGASGVASAGLRLKGTARLDVPLTLNPYGVLRGGPDGFSGEVGLALAITPSITLMVEPQAYAQLGDRTFEHSFTQWTYPIPNIANFEWNKTYRFGDRGPETADGSQASPTADSSASQPDMSASQEAPGAVSQAYSNPVAPEGVPGGPQLDSPTAMQEGAAGNSADAGGMGELNQKMAEVSELAAKISRVAKLVGMVTDIIAIASVSGPLAAAAIPIYLAYRFFIKQDLSFSEIMQAFRDIWEILGFLAEKGLDLLASVIPQWMKDAWEAMQGVLANPQAAIRSVVDWVKTKLQEAVGATWYGILEPFMSFLDGQADKICEIITTIQSGGLNLETLIRLAAQLIGFAISSVIDFIRAAGQVIQRFGGVVRQCVAERRIWAEQHKKYGAFGADWLSADEWRWQIEIPGICNWSGSGGGIGGLDDVAICQGMRLLGVQIRVVGER
ncbi:MAG: hypothetical protein RBU37_08335 [Myxococcota bacterium]|jgi:hypothetical protein|nr:hypothetical protein [Myxococcota bacterium]